MESESCELLELHAFLGRKWSFPLLTRINEEPVSFNDLEKITKTRINPTLLSQRLKTMQSLQLIEKEDNERTQYKITEFGKEVKKLLDEIKQLSEKQGYGIPEKCKGKECVCTIPFKRPHE